jgi:dihydrofolate reductase
MPKRKIILNLCTSLEWYIEWPNGEFDWCFTDQDYGMSEFIKSIDTIFMWRKCYELFLNDIKSNFSDKKLIVFSRTLEDKNIQVINQDIVEEVEKIKNQEWKNIWLFGWAGLTISLLELKLIDEVIISIHPLLLWKWKPLFWELSDRLNLELINSESFSSGLVQVKYWVHYEK